MNLCLLDPFQSDFPEVIEECLEHRVTRCIAFNRRGSLLAAGCVDGACVIWDFDTRGVAKELVDAECTGAICSVSWSKCGRRLLTASAHKKLFLWDVAQGVKMCSFTLEQTALHARLDPGKPLPTVCLACPLSSAPLVVDMEAGSVHALRVEVGAPAETAQAARVTKIADSGLYCPCAASFNKKGDLVYVGNAKGEVLIVEVQSRETLCCMSVPGGAAVKQVAFSRDGQHMLTNSSDRIIRVFDNLVPCGCNLQEWLRSTGAPEDVKSRGLLCLRLSKEFQDSVNRVHWKSACFNCDGECVVGASASKGEHKIHIWNRKFGQLARILECPKEGLADLAWHPTRPIVASVTTTGLVYLWAKDYTENWSAFAPDFKELEENEEYVEREDEFDMPPPGLLQDQEVKAAAAEEEEEEEDVEVDIVTTERVAAFSESDDSEQGLYFLPTGPFPDAPAMQTVEEGRSGSPDSQQQQDGEEESNPGSTEEGRVKRKRKLSKKAAALQADMGKKSGNVRMIVGKRERAEDGQMGRSGDQLSHAHFKRIGCQTASNGLMRYLNIVGKRIPRLRPVAALNPRTPVLPHVA